jgi:hypothetical protein
MDVDVYPTSVTVCASWSPATLGILGSDLAKFILAVFPAQTYYQSVVLRFSLARKPDEWVLSRLIVKLSRTDVPAEDKGNLDAVVATATDAAHGFGIQDAVCRYFSNCRVPDGKWEGSLSLEKVNVACSVPLLMERLLKFATTTWEGCRGTPIVPFSALLEAVDAVAGTYGCPCTERPKLRTTCDQYGARVVLWTAEFEGECDEATAATCRAAIDQVLRSCAGDAPLAAAFNVHWTTPNWREPGRFNMEAVIIPLPTPSCVR